MENWKEIAEQRQVELEELIETSSELERALENELESKTIEVDSLISSKWIEFNLTHHQ